jgi:lipopolysaccharide biosynthesis regulator YciM
VSAFLAGVLPWLVGTAALAAVGWVLWRNYGERRDEPRPDDYLHALELWIEGELGEAEKLLHRVVHADPHAVEPFLYLGNLLRLRGDPERAAVLHRGLTVRPNLTLNQKILAGLSLAEDLNALGRWDESGQVLDTLVRSATGRARYWRARFAQWHGRGDQPEAARTLRNAPRHVPEREREWFRTAYASYQLDRALRHALDGEAGEARARLKDVRDIPGAESRAALVRAVLAAVANDAAGAVTVASEQLLHNPTELGIFLPLLEEVLLQSGQYARTIPILERACQAEDAPASLWVDLAMLYEKLDQREKALRLLESKSRRPTFTPDAAAPYLKMLMAEVPHSDVARVWRMLARPRAADVWVCDACGHRSEHVRWFCPGCGTFDSYRHRASDDGGRP